MRRKIAVLVAQIDEGTQHNFLTSFITEAYACDYDVYIFTMHQKYQETHLRNIGDSNIFELIDYQNFDALVCLMDTIQTPNFVPVLEKRIRNQFDGPVLMIDHVSDHFNYIMMDHYAPVKKLVDHLIEVHGYKDIAFLGGKEGHPHSIQRLKAFNDSMREHGIKVNPEWIYHGNYWYDTGKKFAYQLIESGNMPRAVACANDCMALGLATAFEEKGIRIPEDVAIIGYDSLEEGKDSPAPLTSADIPSSELGRQSFLYIDAMMKGKPKPEFTTETHLFMGDSCGCKQEVKLMPPKRRGAWKTFQADKSVFSDFNHILADLLSASNLDEFLDTIKAYLFQIRPFYSFDMCLNDNFENPEYFVGENAIRSGYTSKMYHVLGVGDRVEEGQEVNKKRVFDVKKILPYDDSERDYPTTYIFNPMFFNDRSFGYTILNCGKNAFLYDKSYRIWMRMVMQGFEAFYRQQYMKMLVEKVQSNYIRDSLTGLYNYEGFLKEVEELEDCTDTYTYDIQIITLDIKGLKSLNEMHGRDFGDRCIKYVAHAINESISEEEIAARMCNDEFLIALVDEEEGNRAEEILTTIEEFLLKHSPFFDDSQGIKLHHSVVSQKQLNNRNKEEIINYAINAKNHIKRVGDTEPSKGNNVADEIRQTQVVDQILSQNLLTYHYQPIVSAEDGSIYAYEALMRDVHGKVSPKQIIDSAVYLKRLPDVERLTLLNVTEDVLNNLQAYKGRKVFINSMPGVGISHSIENILVERLSCYSDQFVIEFTEEDEMSDERLEEFKVTLARIGLKVAIDDYGVGYSNVSNLLRYEPQYIKIDRSLITNVHENPQKQHLIANLIGFAHENDVLVLAEGVENTDELRECIRLGVDLIQGYYTSKPSREVIDEIDSKIKGEIIRYRQIAKDWK